VSLALMREAGRILAVYIPQYGCNIRYHASFGCCEARIIMLTASCQSVARDCQEAVLCFALLAIQPQHFPSSFKQSCYYSQSISHSHQTKALRRDPYHLYHAMIQQACHQGTQTCKFDTSSAQAVSLTNEATVRSLWLLPKRAATQCNNVTFERHRVALHYALTSSFPQLAYKMQATDHCLSRMAMPDSGLFLGSHALSARTRGLADRCRYFEDRESSCFITTSLMAQKSSTSECSPRSGPSLMHAAIGRR
jgi:hypothetical protein